jgi:putative ABC transport system ATP-binding protein
MEDTGNSKTIEISNVTKTYKIGNIDVRALRGANLVIQKGEFVAIMGPSGSGKSTLMNIIGCLDIPTSGSYLLEGIDVSKLKDNQLAEIRNKKVGFVFQTFNLLSSKKHRTAAYLCYQRCHKKQESKNNGFHQVRRT